MKEAQYESNQDSRPHDEDQDSVDPRYTTPLTSASPCPRIHPSLVQEQGHSQGSQGSPDPPLLSRLNYNFNFTSPIRPTHTVNPEPNPTPLFPRLMARGHVVNFDHLPMIADASFSFTGDSIDLDLPSPSPSSPSFAEIGLGRGHARTINKESKKVQVGPSKREGEVEVELEGYRRIVVEKEKEMKEIQQSLGNMTIERNHAIIQEEERTVELKERRWEEVRRGIEDELERSIEYREWLKGLRGLIAQRGGVA